MLQTTVHKWEPRLSVVHELPDGVPNYYSWRWALAMIGIWGFCFVYAVRINMSMAIVCMVKEENINNTNDDNATTLSPDEEKCGTLEGGPTYDVS